MKKLQDKLLARQKKTTHECGNSGMKRVIRAIQEPHQASKKGETQATK